MPYRNPVIKYAFLFKPIGDHLHSVETEGTENVIEDELDKEKEVLKAQANKDESKRRFQVIESGIQNVLFVRTTIEDPVGLVTEILKEIADTNTQKSRHLIRLIPIQKTCKAFEGPGSYLDEQYFISNKSVVGL